MSQHSIHAMHEHSLEAHAAVDRVTREQQVAAIVERFGYFGCTDRAVMRALGSVDPNTVRPRISGLIKKGVLEECGKQKENGRTVRLVRVKIGQRRLF